MNNRTVLQVSVDESKRRKLDREITGDISKDRVWEQWYEEDAFSKVLPKMSQKDYLMSCIGDEPDRIIVDYKGKRQFTVSEFFDYIKLFEKAFQSYNPMVGDVVCTIGLTTPEMYAIKYSCTSLGMITCNLNVFDIAIEDNGKNRLVRQLENVNPSFIFVADVFEDKVRKVINLPQFDNVIKVIMPLDYSLGFDGGKLAMSLKRTLDGEYRHAKHNYKSLDSFLKCAKFIKDEDIKEVYSEGLPCNISFTSGTTGINKAVLISHDANNALAFQHMLSKLGIPRGTRHLSLLPPFLAFWDADIVHTVLCVGCVNIIELKLDYDEMPNFFMKHKNINMGIWPQYHWTALMKLPPDKMRGICDNIYAAIVGGERSDLNEANEFYRVTGIVPKAGYGASEMNTTFSYTHPNVYKPGTAGIPLPFNNIMVLDEDGNKLTYNQRGKLYMAGPCQMNGYFNRPDLTASVRHTDEDGTVWYYSGDYASVDEDGVITVYDRYTEPVAVVYESFDDSGNKITVTDKVNILDIAETVKDFTYVKNCKVTVYDGKIVLHISFRAEKCVGGSEGCIAELIDYLNKNLEYKCLPDYISIKDELPRTSVGKVDYKKVELAGEYICKNVESHTKLKVCR